MKARSLVFLLLLCTLCISPTVFALQYVNVSLVETVTHNVSYNRFFNNGENVSVYTIKGTLNISNTGSETLFDLFLTFYNTQNLLNQSGAGSGQNLRLNETYFVFEAGRNGTDFNGTPPQPITLHIPELRAGDSVRFNYSVSSTLAEPLNIGTDYNLPQNNYYFNKVLAGTNFTIKQNVTNDLPVGANVTGINITIRAGRINWFAAGGFVSNFSLHSVNQSGDSGNVTQFTNLTWNWVPLGGTLPAGVTANITFTILAPNEVPSTDTYVAVEEELAYTAAATASNLSLQDVRGAAKVNITFTKRISQPSSNVRDTNATWEVIPVVTTPVNISYNLTRVTLWVSPSVNPNIYGNDSISGLRLLQNITPGVEVNLTSTWTGSPWYFNYSDGTNDIPPPVVWMKPEYFILNAYGQILNYSLTRNGTDVYVKYIYVISGYWLEIEKNVTNIGPDNYSINVTVRNRGNGHTPQNLTVSVYDVIPAGFTNTTRIHPNPDARQTITGLYNGSALQWDIPRREPYNASLFAAGAASGYDRWNAAYNVTGTGDYRVTDLYIVGLDPRRVDGAFSSPLISILSGVQSYSRELLYVSIVLFLVVLNVMNLVISNRIHHKLGGSDMAVLHQEIRDLKERIKKP